MAIKFLLASSSKGTVIKNLWNLVPNNIYGILTDKNCGAREFAFEHDIKHFDFSQWSEIDNNIPILLIGFKKILKKEHLQGKKIYNIHPSILPLHSGWNEDVHTGVLKSGQKLSGVSLHEVDETIDGGKILRQFPVPVEDNDSVETLKSKCQKVETFLCKEFILGKQSNLWWNLCVESLDS